jgi:subtilisin family serine protease
MNGNKPPTEYDSAFTRRLASFPRTAYYPLPSAQCRTAVVFVIDELLVGHRAAIEPHVTKQLTTLGAVDTGVTVFAGLRPPPSEDVQIWRLKQTPGTGTQPDVAEAVWQTRPLLTSLGIDRKQVAPNHVLIPSPNWHSCPWGPPEQPGGAAVLPPRSLPAGVDVVVIDSGYIDSGPIAARIERPVDYGQWFTGTPNAAAGGFGPPYKWKAQAAEHPNADGNNMLDALAGHADFVAGVIARACPNAQITVADQNGALVWHDDADTPVSTEASVARALWQHRTASLLHVGFAFATLPDAQLAPDTVDMSGPPSWTLELVLGGIARQTVVVCPAGNQGCPVRQYPAAFHLHHENVVGVGSLAPSNTRSTFSNYGPWVACCAEGENVLSTFLSLPTPVPTEEADPPGAVPGSHPAKQFSGWARWSGTSFAAPKVTAAIANGVGTTTPPLSAWLTLKAQHPVEASLEMGHVMNGLPPVDAVP